jgi:hypothetical protein
MNNQRITVTDSFSKDKTLNRKEFRKRWTDAIGRDFFWLDPCNEWQEEIQSFRARVAVKAEEEFDRLYAEQTQESSDE